jgi:hypothetical protein
MPVTVDLDASVAVAVTVSLVVPASPAAIASRVIRVTVDLDASVDVTLRWGRGNSAQKLFFPSKSDVGSMRAAHLSKMYTNGMYAMRAARLSKVYVYEMYAL